MEAEIIEYLQRMNAFLDQYAWFRTYKFVMGLYLVIMGSATFLLLIMLYKKAYFTVAMTGQSFPFIPQGSYLPAWKKVVARLQSSSPNEWKIAVIEAADMVDRVLTTIKYKGDTLGEKLELMNDAQVANRAELKEAVKIRNAIVQQPGYELSQEQAKQTVEAFGKTLQFFLVI